MLDSLPQFVQLALERQLPPKIDYGIAFVGCGGIVNYGHIPSYQANGFNLIGGYDVNRQAAEKTVQEHGLSKVYDSLDDLLADPAVEIVDIAVVPWEQFAVVEKVVAAQKNLLCQKPFSDNYKKAVQMARLAKEAGVKIAVHQQFRWGQIIRATRALLTEGWVGNLLDVQVQVSIATPWDLWPWLADQPRLETLYHSIHYLDALRFLFGNPALVTSRHTKNPAQKAKGETKTITVWDYSTGLQILVAVCHYDWSE
ncbi:MAG TPA: Gfo/Idh/MocA family oxidoreductase, partial [Anaerolineales bacterium]|nr:Gfo/Idh/MocA family oxidoreductase [Anaerolineales bacterium]